MTPVADPIAHDFDAAFDRWSYGEGYTAGRNDGVRVGFADGYRAGFDAGVEVGAARLLLAVEHGLSGQLPTLLPALPHAGHYQTYRQRTRPSNEPCEANCGSCSRCIRAAAVRRNLARFGQGDYPGTAASGSGGGRS